MRTNRRAARTNAVTCQIPRPSPHLLEATIPTIYQQDPLPAQKIPTPYNIPWTSHLIKRDLKDLMDKVKNKTMAKVDKLWGKSRPASGNNAEAFYNSDNLNVRFPSSSRHDDMQDSSHLTQLDRLWDRSHRMCMRQNGGALPPCLKDLAPKEIPDGLDFHYTDSMVADLWADFDGVHLDEYSETDNNEESVYDILTSFLDKYWMDRPKDEEHGEKYIAHEERFRTRGLLVLLRLVLENCPSNPRYADLNKGQQCFDDFAFKLTLLEEVNVVKLKAILSNLARYQVKVSEMPGELNHRRLSSVHLRIDSLLVEEEQDKRIEVRPAAAVIPSPSDLWYAIMVACSERSVTQKVVEPLLRLVEPAMDVDKFLIRIGDPGQMVPIDQQNVLRKKLLPFLFPELDDLAS